MTDIPHKREACLRCCISRAYYSSFHHSKQVLYDKWNILVSDNASAHAEVWSFFKQRGEKDMAWKLKYMRNARNRADYNNQVANLEKLAKEVLKLAIEVIGDLGKL